MQKRLEFLYKKRLLAGAPEPKEKTEKSRKPWKNQAVPGTDTCVILHRVPYTCKLRVDT